VLPFTFSSIKFWLNLQSDNAPGNSHFQGLPWGQKPVTILRRLDFSVTNCKICSF
jgi:hypothetical protein